MASDPDHFSSGIFIPLFPSIEFQLLHPRSVAAAGPRIAGRDVLPSMTEKILRKPNGLVEWLGVGAAFCSVAMIAYTPDDYPTMDNAVHYIFGTATAGDTGAIPHNHIVRMNMASDPGQRPKPPRHLPTTTTKIITDTGTVDS